MKKIIAIIIVVLCVFATFGTTAIFVNVIKDQETLDLKAQYTLDEKNMKDQISSLNSQINSLTDQLGDYNKDVFYGYWAEIDRDENWRWFFDELIFFADGKLFLNGDLGGFEPTHWLDDNKLYYGNSKDDLNIQIFQYSFVKNPPYDKTVVLTDVHGNSATFVGYDFFDQ